MKYNFLADAISFESEHHSYGVNSTPESVWQDVPRHKADAIQSIYRLTPREYGVGLLAALQVLQMHHIQMAGLRDDHINAGCYT